MAVYHRYDLEFFTATILKWKHLLANDEYKQILMDSLQFLVEHKRIYLCAYIIMNNHIHIIWQAIHPHQYSDVQRDFLKYTAQMIIKDLRCNNKTLLEELRVDAKDRKYQVWERNALSVHLRSEAVVLQKLNYIHDNPVKAGLCNDCINYKYSSANYYETGNDLTGLITHYRD